MERFGDIFEIHNSTSIGGCLIDSISNGFSNPPLSFEMIMVDLKSTLI